MISIKLSLVASSALIALSLTGCNSDSGDPTSVNKKVLEVGNSHCPYGGAELIIGFDTNLDGIVNDITQTEYVCNGEPGQNGADGQNGSDGQNGADGQNGSDGQDGLNGQDGADGQNGADGQDGADGYSTLLLTEDITDKEICGNGGVKISTGLDTNRDGVLDTNEISNTQNICFMGSGESESNASKVLSLDFPSVSVPTKEDEKKRLSTVSSLSMDGEVSDFTYKEIVKTGYTDTGEVFCAVKDVDGNQIKFDDGSLYLCNDTNNGSGSGLDFSSILQ